MAKKSVKPKKRQRKRAIEEEFEEFELTATTKGWTPRRH